MYLIKIRVGCKCIYYCQVGHPIPMSARGLIQCTSCKDLSWGAGKVPNMVVIMQRAVKGKNVLPLIFQTGHFYTYSPSSLKEEKCLDITIWMSSCRKQPNNPSIPRCFSASFHFFCLLLPFRYFACDLEHRVKTKPTLPNLAWHQQFNMGFHLPQNPKKN